MRCPTCGQKFAVTQEPEYTNKKLAQLKRERVLARKMTFSKSRIKKEFNLKCSQIDKIPITYVCGKVRYLRKDLIEFLVKQKGQGNLKLD